MLSSLTIRNFVVADDIQMAFEDGFTVLMGETGAGKSVIIDALSVCLGAKASLAKIRDSEGKAFIECVFSLDDDFLSRHVELSEYVEDDRSLVISASFNAKGTVTRKVNGQTVTQGMVRRLCEDLVMIYSQGSSQSLFTSEGQLEILDLFGGEAVRDAMTEYGKAYGSYLEARKELDDFIADSKKEDPEFLRYRIGEIEKWDIHENEIEDCEDRLNELSSGEDLTGVVEEIASLSEPFEEVKGRLMSIAGRMRDTSLSEAATRLVEGLECASQAIDEIDNANLDVDPMEIDRLNQRLFDLSELRRKYGRKTSDILSALADMKMRLEDLEGFEDEKKRREDAIRRLLEEARRLGGELSTIRERTADELGTKVSSVMDDLALADGGFRVISRHTDSLTSKGMDEIMFQVRLNKGFGYSPLKDAASGGEGSRIMLALKSVLQNAYPSMTLVFDEIDTGISGPIAFKVGEKLYSISKDSQTFCITHLPQVASFFDHAYWIEKGVVDDVTVTSAYELAASQTQEKIGMMMGGTQSSEVMIKSAKELIKEANARKKE